MILALDVYYRAGAAKTVGALFCDWADARPTEILTEFLFQVAAYEPGAFYKRELPCLMALIEKLDLAKMDAIVVDGYVFLDDDGRKGLGAILFDTLGGKVPVVGVAKTSFANNTLNVAEVYRGNSKHPLYISAVGMDLEKAARRVKEMHGGYRIPTLLKMVDQETKAGGFDQKRIGEIVQAELQKISPRNRYWAPEGCHNWGWRDPGVVIGGYAQGEEEVLESIPSDSQALYWLRGGGDAPLMGNILLLDWVDQLRVLMIGRCMSGSVDYSGTAALVGSTSFPQLRKFSFGDEVLVGNEESIYGNLGNLTDLLMRMPKLQDLELFGTFEMGQPARLPRLQELDYWMCGSQKTSHFPETHPDSLAHLLASEMPEVEQVGLVLDCEGGREAYYLPQNFLHGENIPNLRKLELSGRFRPGTRKALEESYFFQVYVELQFDEDYFE
jgi:deoxyribonuclease V